MQEGREPPPLLRLRMARFSGQFVRSPALLRLPPQGFITSAEFLAIPELSINPLAKRLAYMFESINFKELVVSWTEVLGVSCCTFGFVGRACCADRQLSLRASPF